MSRCRGAMVHHSGHRIWIMSTRTATFQATLVFAHKDAKAGRTQNSGNQNTHKKYRSRRSQSHLETLPCLMRQVQT